MPRDQYRTDRDERSEFDERVVHIARTAKVIKGGRRFAFRVVAVVGDNRGKVGLGVGKAREVPDAIRKAVEQAKKHMIEVPLVGNTIPHQVLGQHSAAQVMLKPASPGTGVIAGSGVRAVVEAAGVRDILTKSQGSSNILNVVRATFEGLERLKDPAEEARRRGRPIESVRPIWSRGDGQPVVE